MHRIEIFAVTLYAELLGGGRPSFVDPLPFVQDPEPWSWHVSVERSWGREGAPVVGTTALPSSQWYLSSQSLAIIGTAILPSSQSLAIPCLVDFGMVHMVTDHAGLVQNRFERTIEPYSAFALFLRISLLHSYPYKGRVCPQRGYTIVDGMALMSQPWTPFHLGLHGSVVYLEGFAFRPISHGLTGNVGCVTHPVRDI